MNNKVNYWQYLDEYHEHREAILQIVDRVFSSGKLILGCEVENFEKTFSAYCETEYGVGVNSGTDALFLALKALDIGEGDEVITVSNTAVPTVSAIRATGAMPVFVDVEEDTFLMDVTKIESVITTRTKCILPVHLLGQSVDMDPLLEIANKRNLKVLEDCAQATGATYKGKKVGSFGDIGAFSFYPTKVLGGYGDGGMIITKEKKYFEKLKRLRFYGMQKTYYSEEEGYNSRLDEVHAAILTFKLKLLDESVQKRRQLAEIYSRELMNIEGIELPFVKSDCTHQFYVYTIKSNSRYKLMQYLNEKNIGTNINYLTPIHLMRGYDFLKYTKGDLPITEKLSDRILSLPMFPALEKNSVNYICQIIREFKECVVS